LVEDARDDLDDALGRLADGPRRDRQPGRLRDRDEGRLDLGERIPRE